MVAVAHVQPPAWPPGVSAEWWEQFEAPPGYRAEVIQGEIVLSPSPVFRHQVVATRLGSMLGEACPDGYVAAVDMEWRLDAAGLVAQAPQPDVIVVKPIGSGFETPPLLAVEVLSPSDDRSILGGDLTRFDGKAIDYRRNGLEFLLVVQPELEVVFLLAADDEDWREIARARGDHMFGTELPFPMRFRPRDLVKLG